MPRSTNDCHNAMHIKDESNDSFFFLDKSRIL